MNEERLKADLDFERTKRKTLSHELRQLKAENENLRKSLSDSLMFKFQSQDKELEKYKQCLDEIEARVLNENADELLEWIVEKIKEVKDNG